MHVAQKFVNITHHTTGTGGGSVILLFKFMTWSTRGRRANPGRVEGLRIDRAINDPLLEQLEGVLRDAGRCELGLHHKACDTHRSRLQPPVMLLSSQSKREECSSACPATVDLISMVQTVVRLPMGMQQVGRDEERTGALKVVAVGVDSLGLCLLLQGTSPYASA